VWGTTRCVVLGGTWGGLLVTDGKKNLFLMEEGDAGGGDRYGFFSHASPAFLRLWGLLKKKRLKGGGPPDIFQGGLCAVWLKEDVGK